MSLVSAPHAPTPEATEDMAHACSSIWALACPAHIHRPPLPPAPFRFLDLPGEMQNRIMDEFVISDEPITIRMPRFNRHPSPPPKTRERPRYDRLVPPTPPLSRSASCESTRPEDRDLGHTRLALMLACRKLYREHWRTYYGHNTFDFNLETLGRYLEQIPHRCTQQIRRIRFRMPHKYHHARIWNLLAQLKRLEEVELVLCAPSLTEELEYRQAREGVKHCKRLLRFSFSRAEEIDDPKSDARLDEVARRDRQVEDQIRQYLSARECRRREKARGLCRPVRTSQKNDFPMTEAESSSSG